MEQAQQFARVGGHSLQFRVAGNHGVPVGPEGFEPVYVVLAFGTGHGPGQEVGRAAAQQHVGADVVEHGDDSRLFVTASGVSHVGRRGGVLQLGVGHDADGHAGFATQNFGQGFLFGIVKRVGGAVGIYAQGVDAGLVARGVGAHGVGRVGGDGVHAARADKSHVGHGIHGQATVELALGHARGQQTRRRAMPHAEAVGDEQDDVFGFALARGRHFPGDGLLLIARFGRYRIIPGRQTDPAHDDGRALAFFIGDIPRLAFQNPRIVRAVDGQRNVGFRHAGVKLDLEVEQGARQHGSPVDGVHGGGAAHVGQSQAQGHTARQDGQQDLANMRCVHGLFPSLKNDEIRSESPFHAGRAKCVRRAERGTGLDIRIQYDGNAGTV